MSAAKGYRVALPLAHDGREYAPGDRVELDEDRAAHLLATGVVTAAKATEAAKTNDGDGQGDDAGTSGDDDAAKPAKAKRKAKAKD